MFGMDEAGIKKSTLIFVFLFYLRSSAKSAVKHRVCLPVDESVVQCFQNLSDDVIVAKTITQATIEL
jgi:hypothetical protein